MIDVERMQHALRLIAGDRCQHYTRPQWACLEPNSGRTKDAEFLAQQWCESCTAHWGLVGEDRLQEQSV